MLALTNETEEMVFDTFARFFGVLDANSPDLDGASLWQRFAELGGDDIVRGSEIGENLVLPALVARAAGRGVALVPYCEHVHARSLLSLAAVAVQSIAPAGTSWTVATGGADQLLVQGGAVAGAFVHVGEQELRCYSLPEAARVALPNLGAFPMARVDVRSCDLLAAVTVDVAMVTAASADRAIVEAAWSIGAAEVALDLVTAHVRDRKQFDQPIGSFQALQHRLADCVAQLDGASLLLDRAARLGWSDTGRHRLAAAGVLAAATTAELIGRETVQMFGGYGVCDEYAASHVLRRVKARKAIALDGFRAEDVLAGVEVVGS